MGKLSGVDAGMGLGDVFLMLMGSSQEAIDLVNESVPGGVSE